MAVATAALPSASLAQPRKLARVGYLSGISAESGRPWLAAFQAGLRDLGYVEGKTIVVEQRYSAGRNDRLAALGRELAALKVDVFLVYGPAAAIAARDAVADVPIVMANVQDPVASGLVTSLSRPGGRITGLSDSHSASVTKRLELLKELIPSGSRIGVMWNPNSAPNRNQIRDLEMAAGKLGLAIVSLPVTLFDDIEAAFITMKKARADALLLLGDVVFTSHHKMIAERALKERMPAMYTIPPFVQAGGLVAYGADFADMFRRAASYVDKILKGAKPGDLPIEQPTKFELRINLRTAKALGVSVPRSVLLRADEVIE